MLRTIMPGIDIVTVEGSADAAEQQDRQLAAEVLAKLTETGQHAARILRVVEMVVEFGRVDGQAHGLDHVDDAAPLPFAQRAGEMRVRRVQRQADADRLAVPQAVLGQRFQLVRGPVAVVERTRGALLERIAALRDVREVQRGRSPDDLLHHRQVARLQGGGMAVR